jgi:DNA-directed RNA polymerase beta subunit
MIDNPLQTNTNGLGRRTSQAPVRVDFSKIYTSARIPNLIEVQRESYNRFLQMDLIPEERDMVGLQTVFQSIFPVSDFRETATLEFVEYQIGNWQCKCGNLEGLEHLRANCKECALPKSKLIRSARLKFSVIIAELSISCVRNSAQIAANRRDSNTTRPAGMSGARDILQRSAQSQNSLDRL